MVELNSRRIFFAGGKESLRSASESADAQSESAHEKRGKARSHAKSVAAEVRTHASEGNDEPESLARNIDEAHEVAMDVENAKTGDLEEKTEKLKNGLLGD